MPDNPSDQATFDEQRKIGHQLLDLEYDTGAVKQLIEFEDHWSHVDRGSIDQELQALCEAKQQAQLASEELLQETPPLGEAIDRGQGQARFKKIQKLSTKLVDLDEQILYGERTLKKRGEST